MDRLKPMLAVLVLAALVSAAGAQQQETPKRYILTLKTATQLPMFQMPMLPDMPNMPDFGNMPEMPAMPDLGNLPDMPDMPGMPDLGALGGGMPNMEGMPDMAALMGKLQNAPTRSITGEATYPTQAVAPIWVTVPKDLKLAKNRLVLEVPQPVPDVPVVPGTDEPTPVEKPTGKLSVTDRLYWHPETARGPIEDSSTVDLSQMPTGPEAPAAINAGQDRMAEWMADREKTADGSESELPEKVVGKGNYVLNTGNINIPLDGFLPPVKVTSPAKMADITPAEGITVTWEPVAGARGFILHAMGSRSNMFGAAPGGKKPETMEMLSINWVSTLEQPPARAISGYEIETSITDDLAAGILLPADTTSCVVPAGIFPEDLDMFTLTVTAIGNDFYNKTDTLVTRGFIRAEWSAMKMNMPAGLGMPDGMDAPGDDADDEVGNATGGADEAARRAAMARAAREAEMERGLEAGLVNQGLDEGTFPALYIPIRAIEGLEVPDAF
jgi:hypothetical protein